MSTGSSAETTSMTTSPQSGAGRSSGLAVQSRRSDLVTPQGRTSIADSVVEKIAGVAASEVAGVHAMGKGRARAIGAIKEKLPVVSGASPSQGVNVEVGERQAAVDLDLVADYGVSIVEVAQSVRQHVIESIEQMTGLEVTEVNVSVDDVWMGEDESESRVQ